MNLENHERAKKLLTMRRVEGIPAVEEQWLEDHLAHCNACSNAAQALTDAITAVRSFSVTARPDEQLAPNRPSFSVLPLYSAMRSCMLMRSVVPPVP